MIAMNHWQLAIETHNTNFPDTTHVLTDISTADPRRYPSTDILITSPECTNHSLSKGQPRKNQGQLSLFGENQFDPAEERSRATMWDVPRFAEYHNYRAIIVENVIDARYWRLFDAWLHAMQLLDYEHKIVYFNSQFAHPTPQSRDRMYVVFWKRGNRPPDLHIKPRAFCPKCDQQVEAEQSWKKGRAWGRYQTQYVYLCPHCAGEVNPYYFPAYTAIDWTLPVQRIGDRDRPLKPRTLERIAYGLKKFQQAAMVPTGHTGSDERRGHPVDGPYPTQTTRQTLGLAVPPFLMAYYTRRDTSSGVDDPLPTVTAENRFGVVIPPFLAIHYGGNHAKSIDEPLGTITTVDHHSLICPPYLVELYRTGKAREVTEPFSTVVASGNHHGLVIPPLLASYYGSDNVRSVDDPIGTVTAIDRHALVEPAETLKVEDCGFRMIQPHEIQAAMAFPRDYVVLGTKRDKVRQLGNAVTPPVMQVLVERCVETLR
jgi:DNA (cytosine-5)-methyltransferase 1